MYTAKQGDRAEPLIITTSANLTGVTFTKIRWRLRDESAGSTDGDETLLSIVSAGPTGSVVSYPFRLTETDTIGLFKGEIKVTKGGLPLTIPSLANFEFRITEPLPAPPP